jgi:hypothetical protein
MQGAVLPILNKFQLLSSIVEILRKKDEQEGGTTDSVSVTEHLEDPIEVF